jgi:hypothetical protein
MNRNVVHLRSRRSVLVVAISGLVAAIACTDGPSQVEFIDLVAENRFEVDGERLKPGETFAVDETWVAVEVDAGRSITADIKLQSKPVLDFAGTLVCSNGSTTDEALEILVGVKGGGGWNLNRSYAVAETGAWWSHSLDLGKLGRRRVEVEFEARAPRECRLLLRKATIRQIAPGRPRTIESPPQVLLVSVDTLRKDAIGAFGGSVETPHLDRFASESQLWTRHYAAATWTKPSHASMLTGYHVDTHRAIHLHQAMDPAIPTLAERFQSGGLTTAALVYDCGWLSRKWGFGKGFDDYRLTQWRAGRQATAAAQWVVRHRDEPFFYFVHTFEPHSDSKVLPYEAPGVNRRTIAEQFGVRNFGRRQGRRASQFLVALDRGEIPRQTGDVEILRATYAKGVRYLDESLGVLFDALRESGVWDQLLVVVTSDHGEQFDEHGGFEHGSLYEEIVAEFRAGGNGQRCAQLVGRSRADAPRTRWSADDRSGGLPSRNEVELPTGVCRHDRKGGHFRLFQGELRRFGSAPSLRPRVGSR